MGEAGTRALRPDSPGMRQTMVRKRPAVKAAVPCPKAILAAFRPRREAPQSLRHRGDRNENSAETNKEARFRKGRGRRRTLSILFTRLCSGAPEGCANARPGAARTTQVDNAVSAPSRGTAGRCTSSSSGEPIRCATCWPCARRATITWRRGHTRVVTHERQCSPDHADSEFRRSCKRRTGRGERRLLGD